MIKDCHDLVWYQPMGFPAYYCRKSKEKGWEVKLNRRWQGFPDDLPFSESDLDKLYETRNCDVLERGYAILTGREIGGAPSTVKVEHLGDGLNCYFQEEP